ncbi:MAG: hypothetical protein ABIH23_23270 [bacterium]
MKNWGMCFHILACALGVQSQSTADSIPRQDMPEKVYEILREAVESCIPGVGQRDDWLKRNTEALEHLRNAPWPDLGKLKRVRIHGTDKESGFFYAWQLSREEEQLRLVTHDFRERYLSMSKISKVEIIDYSDELSILTKHPEHRSPYDFKYFWGRGGTGCAFHGGALLVHHAYAAAYFGKREEAKILVYQALKRNCLSFEDTYNEAAWQSFARGIDLLENGAPRTEVLAQWKETLEVYGQSKYREQLLDLTAQLTEQVREDEILNANSPKDLDELTVQEQIDYCIARCPDVHGVQFGWPGRCIVLSVGGIKEKGTRFSDHLVAIGRPAVPKLIDHLTDRRFTRSIACDRDFIPHRIVLRVQDVAVECIEKILDVDFYDYSSTGAYPSTEKPEIREKVIEDIRSWWKEYGDRSYLEGQLARLRVGTVYQRTRTLEKIEKIDKNAVDSIGALKGWGEGAENKEQLAFIAEELAKRGDLSFLSTIRRVVRETAMQNPEFCYDTLGLRECVWFIAKYGDADDYLLLRQAARQGREAGAKGFCDEVMSGLPSSGAKGTPNPLVVPILVDFLGCREITGTHHTGGIDGKSVDVSRADSCIEMLIRLTEHNEGYNPADPIEKRYAAIDRWIVWWKAEGEAAYCRAHPEVLEVLEEPGTEPEQ